MTQIALLDAAGRPTLAAAIIERDEVIQRCLESAESIKTQWGRNAYKYLILYARTHYEFIAQDVVRAFKDEGFETPHTDRAWGAVFQRAAKVCIEFSGYDKAPHRHASVCLKYRSKIFRRGE